MVKKGSEISLADYDAEPDLNSLMKEVMRVHAPVSRLGIRKVIKDFKLLDLKVKKDTLISVCISSLHNDPLVYSNPEKFNPDRFKEGAKDSRPGYGYAPFSHGYRDCIGRNFGELMVKIIVLNVVKNFIINQPKNISYNKIIDLGLAVEFPNVELKARND